MKSPRLSSFKWTNLSKVKHLCKNHSWLKECVSSVCFTVHFQLTYWALKQEFCCRTASFHRPGEQQSGGERARAGSGRRYGKANENVNRASQRGQGPTLLQNWYLLTVGKTKAQRGGASSKASQLVSGKAGLQPQAPFLSQKSWIWIVCSTHSRAGLSNLL